MFAGSEMITAMVERRPSSPHCSHSKVCDLLEQDIRNNSAWNQRWFVCHRGKTGTHLSLQGARKEADFAMEEGARLDPYNESPWRYLIGILREQQQQSRQASEEMLVEYETRAKSLESVLIDARRNPDACVNMTSARIDLLEMIGTKESLKTSILLAEALATEHDTIRTKYWSLVLKRLRNKENLLTEP